MTKKTIEATRKAAKNLIANTEKYPPKQWEGLVSVNPKLAAKILRRKSK